MATRQVRDAKDSLSGELIYFKGHAQAVYMSDGTTVEDAINNIEITGGGSGGSIDTSNLATKTELAQKQDIISDIDTIRTNAANYKGTVTSIKINGQSKSPSSGIVDLGTVITSHQDISGKQDKLVSGTNIKTINGTSILGSGDIEISGGGGGGSSSDCRKEVIYYDTPWPIRDMRPNVIYWVSGIQDLVIQSFEAPEYGVDIYDIFTAIIDIGANGGEEISITLPEYVLWANGTFPEIKPITYELSISRISDGDIVTYMAVLTPFKLVE